MDSKTLQALKRYYWLIFVVNMALIVGAISSVWAVPVSVLRAYPVVFVTIALLLGGGMGTVFGLAHVVSQTLVNTPATRMKLVLYGSLVLGMLFLGLLLLSTMYGIIELKFLKLLTGIKAAQILGNLYFYAWLTCAFLVHGLAGFRLSGLSGKPPVARKRTGK